jgi:hypothetical protein
MNGKERMMKLDHEVAQIGIRLLDDAYMAWFAAESESESALRTWFEGRAQSREAGYVAYRAALDREEAAAHDLDRLCKVAQPCRGRLTYRGEGAID